MPVLQSILIGLYMLCMYVCLVQILKSSFFPSLLSKIYFSPSKNVYLKEYIFHTIAHSESAHRAKFIVITPFKNNAMQ